MVTEKMAVGKGCYC